MSLLCWNCRGLGNRQTVQELSDLVRVQDPTKVFLAEPWLDEVRLTGLRDSLRFGHHHGVSCLTRGGGLVLFWKKDFDLQVMSSSHNHIDILINRGKVNVWRFTGFYGAPETQLRMESWDLLRDLNNRFSVPWLVGGDFNKLLKSQEKLGGWLRPYGQMLKFREALDECGLFDLGFVGCKFTWHKTYPDGGIVWERLDRAVCTTKVKTLVCASSDHSPILVLPDGISLKSQCPWRFENIWLEEQGCHDTVKNAWKTISSEPPMPKVMMNIDTCKTQLRVWSKNSFGSVCFRRNSITELRDSRGRIASGDENVSEMIIEYYKQLFTTSNPHDIEEVVQHTKKVVSDDMNNCLTRNFSKDEVEKALKQMAPLKAPRPDGMPPIFFQHYWESIGDDVVKAVISCLNSNSIEPGLNHTFIALIPKVKSPEFVTEFRPIALCNILYKLVSKVLANRLKKVLPHIISDSQSAFQSDKAISDNIWWPLRRCIT
ncbi:uncharacterized protein LOC115964800 [Quercus lobata]|uniref:uncharacterized protein LOC115964800 n=1 Tax=Quercus lobata TaxID=97700 RepID=UPI0012445A63|nr:uncharacterized protein LOC115964800 [Quercus lobata]